MSEEDGMRAAHLEAHFAEMDGYTAEARAGELLLGVGIPVEQHFGPMSEVAPGWKLRVLLAQVLFSDPDIMLLDEPTNHLDMESIESLNLALENYLGTLFVVSHDREFVSSLATRILELTPTGIVDFHGSYEDYLRKQEAA